MTKDYRLHNNTGNRKMLRRFRRHITYSLIVLGFGAAIYAIPGYRSPDNDTGNAVINTGNLTEERITLALPVLKESESVLEDTGMSKDADSPLTTVPVLVQEDSTSSTDSTLTTTLPENEVASDNPISASESIDENSKSAEEDTLANSQDDSQQNTLLENEVRWLKEKVKKGDSISRIFSRLNLSASLLHRILNSSDEAKQLASIRPGEMLKVKIDGEGNFLGLILERNAIKSLNIQAKDGDFHTRTVERGLETRIASASGTITNSLYESAQRTGLSDQLIMELANIFGWDIDFALEIRAGDQFSLIYEDEYLDGELYGNGSILAAEFVNRGTVFRALRYEDKTGNTNYFSPDGHSMRKAFLRAPVDFRRISSRFTKARWHPVLGKKRPHKGVDYAAAIGTPIKAAGDGRVIFRGRKGGYGNTVIIQHGSQYTTLYGHMSSFKSSVKSGSRVKQGQTIGYVGKSGLATGPHLHYEFRVNGTHRNPLTVKIPAASPINAQYKADFEKKSKPLLAQLDLISRTQVATAE